jgi:hypothetical protein
MGTPRCRHDTSAGSGINFNTNRSHFIVTFQHPSQPRTTRAAHRQPDEPPSFRSPAWSPVPCTFRKRRHAQTPGSPAGMWHWVCARSSEQPTVMQPQQQPADVLSVPRHGRAPQPASPSVAQLCRRQRRLAMGWLALVLLVLLLSAWLQPARAAAGAAPAAGTAARVLVVTTSPVAAGKFVSLQRLAAAEGLALEARFAAAPGSRPRSAAPWWRWPQLHQQYIASMQTGFIDDLIAHRSRRRRGAAVLQPHDGAGSAGAACCAGGHGAGRRAHQHADHAQRRGAPRRVRARWASPCCRPCRTGAATRRPGPPTRRACADGCAVLPGPGRIRGRHRHPGGRGHARRRRADRAHRPPRPTPWWARR